MNSPLTPALRLHASWVSSFFNPSDEHSTESVLVKKLLSSDARAVHEGLANIASHIASGKEARRSFRENAGIPAVIHIVATNLPEKSMLTTAAMILEKLTEDDEAAAEIGEREGVQALVDLFCYYQGDFEVCRAVVSTMRNLTTVTENRARMLEYRVLELLINAIDELKNDKLLAECIPGAVANIVFGCRESRVRCGELGAIARFTNCLDIHSTSSKVVTQLAFGIRNLVWECPLNLKRVSQAHTIEVMLNILSMHRECIEVVTQILGVFANIVSADSSIRCNMLREKTFFLDMFHILSFFVAESELCATLCFVLFTIAEHDLQHERHYAKTIAHHCKEIEGYKGIISSLEHAIFNKNKDALAKICHLIHVFCVSEEFRRDIGRANVLDLPVKALQESVFDDEISISKLLCCIRGIVSGNDEAKLMFRELDGFPITLEIMKRHNKSLMVILKCTQVLDNTADGQLRTTEQLLDRKDEVAKELQAAMSKFPECANLQENACSILVKIASISREEASRLMQAGVLRSVELAKSSNAGNPGVESLANQLLSLLMDTSSRREGRRNARGNASTRLRSRSRTVESSNRPRSRADTSKSPDRIMKQARCATGTAKMKQRMVKGAGNLQKQSSESSVTHSKRSTRNKLSLEPVYE